MLRYASPQVKFGILTARRRYQFPNKLKISEVSFTPNQTACNQVRMLAVTGRRHASVMPNAMGSVMARVVDPSPRSHSAPTNTSFARNFSLAAADAEEVTGGGGLLRLLTQEERELLSEQRELSQKARNIASLVGTVQVRDCTVHFLEEMMPETCDPSTFSIVVAGEFNAGKSTLINALLGQQLLETGALPTTDSITILAHGNEDETHHNLMGRMGVDLHRVSTVPLLQDLTLIDTPGTNAVVADHSARTMKLLPTADLILFVTNADRPFPESERTLLQSIQAYRKSIVVVINKMDVLEITGGSYGEQQKLQVVNFVTENASELLGARPIVIPVSARDALAAKLTNKNNLNESRMWERSNFAELEFFLKDTLTTETKIKSKLLNPIGVAEGMMTECVNVLKEQEKELETDVATLSLLQSQFDRWTKEMNIDMDTFRREIKDILLTEGQRCQILCDRMRYFDQVSWTILDRGRFDWEWRKTRQSTVDTKDGLEKQILELVNENADGLATRARAQGQAVIEYLGKRPAIKSHNLVGSVTAASRFEDTKELLTQRLSDFVAGVLSDVDESSEESVVLNSFRTTIALSAAANLCAALTACATAVQVVEIVPGVTSSLMLATLGTYSVSYRNARTVKEHQKTWVERSKKLDVHLNVICSKELQRVQRRILDGVAPYTRYVETEQERVQRLTEECEAIFAGIHIVRRRIKQLRHE